jgi:hypothetical protein
MTHYCLVGGYRLFGVTYCIHLHGLKMRNNMSLRNVGTYEPSHMVSNSEDHSMNPHRRKNRACCILDAVLNFVNCVA